MYKILIIAGEPSGDNLGSNLIKEMKIQFEEIVHSKNYQNKELLFQGIGGPKMKNEGFVCLYKIDELSIMGFFDVFKSLRKIYSIIFAINSPDFCFRLVNKIRKIDKFVPIIHYVAPSVWAWRPKRAKLMSLMYDKVLALLPFEKPYFEKYGLSCDFVGHPISKLSIPLDNERENFFKTMEIDVSKKIITILPGSRKSEIKSLLPIYLKLIDKLSIQFNDISFVMPIPENISNYIRPKLNDCKTRIKILSESKMGVEKFDFLKFSLFKFSTLAINTSGSVSLELAKTGTPMVSIYKCGWLFKKIIKSFVKLKSANLINIILKKQVIPEFLFEKCKVLAIESSVKDLLSNPSLQKEQKDAFDKVIKLISTDEYNQSEKAAQISLQYLKEKIL